MAQGLAQRLLAASMLGRQKKEEMNQSAFRGGAAIGAGIAVAASAINDKATSPTRLNLIRDIGINKLAPGREKDIETALRIIEAHRTGMDEISPLDNGKLKSLSREDVAKRRSARRDTRKESRRAFFEARKFINSIVPGTDELRRIKQRELMDAQLTARTTKAPSDKGSSEKNKQLENMIKDMKDTVNKTEASAKDAEGRIVSPGNMFTAEIMRLYSQSLDRTQPDRALSVGPGEFLYLKSAINEISIPDLANKIDRNNQARQREVSNKPLQGVELLASDNFLQNADTALDAAANTIANDIVKKMSSSGKSGLSISALPSFSLAVKGAARKYLDNNKEASEQFVEDISDRRKMAAKAMAQNISETVRLKGTENDDIVRALYKTKQFRPNKQVTKTIIEKVVKDKRLSSREEKQWNWLKAWYASQGIITYDQVEELKAATIGQIEMAIPSLYGGVGVTGKYKDLNMDPDYAKEGQKISIDIPLLKTDAPVSIPFISDYTGIYVQ